MKIKEEGLEGESSMGNYSIEEIRERIIDYEIATEEEINLVSDINGYSEETLNSIIYVKTGYNEIEQFEEELGIYQELISESGAMSKTDYVSLYDTVKEELELAYANVQPSMLDYLTRLAKYTLDENIDGKYSDWQINYYDRDVHDTFYKIPSGLTKDDFGYDVGNIVLSEMENIENKKGTPYKYAKRRPYLDGSAVKKS